jgi:hypothetical protein
MFLAESHSALMLFDSGASHSFITKRFALAYDFPRSKLSAPMLVQAPGSNLDSDTICLGVELSIMDVTFWADLIVIGSRDIDIILGMDWLSKYKGKIDCARRSIRLTNDSGETIRFSPKAIGARLYALNDPATTEMSGILVGISLMCFQRSYLACPLIVRLCSLLSLLLVLRLSLRDHIG